MKRVYNPAVQENVLKFAAGVQAKIAEHYAKNLPRQAAPEILVEWGIKNAKLVKAHGGKPESVYCFVSLENGDILKAAGYKKPAPHARGSVMKPDFGVSDVGVYGPAYLI